MVGPAAREGRDPALQAAESLRDALVENSGAADILDAVGGDDVDVPERTEALIADANPILPVEVAARLRAAAAAEDPSEALSQLAERRRSEVAGTVGQQRLNRVVDYVSTRADEHLDDLAALGRWQGRVEQPPYHPVDVLGLAVSHAHHPFKALAALVVGPDDQMREPVRDAGVAMALAPALVRMVDALPFFLGETVAPELLASDPPPWDDLAGARLPGDVVVGLEAPVQLPTQTRELEDGDGELVEEPLLTGAVILTDEKQRPTGEVALMLSGDIAGVTADDDIVVVPSLFPLSVDGPMEEGSIAAAARACTNLIAAIAFGAWNSPPPLDIPDTSQPQARRKALRKGKVRRAARAGALTGVRTLDLGAVMPRDRGESDAGDAQRRSPRAHIRRGHWRRVRVGPRTDWRYRARWIPPSVVASDGPRAPGKVYRLPPEGR